MFCCSPTSTPHYAFPSTAADIDGDLGVAVARGEPENDPPDVCDPYIRTATETTGPSLPLETRSTTLATLSLSRQGEDGDCRTRPAGRSDGAAARLTGGGLMLQPARVSPLLCLVT